MSKSSIEREMSAAFLITHFMLLFLCFTSCNTCNGIDDLNKKFKAETKNGHS